MSRCHGDTVIVCIVCDYMGICYVKLSQLDAAEEMLSQSLRIKTDTLPQGHNSISTSKIQFSYFGISQFVLFLAEQQLHQVWQLKFGQ